jgi:cytochrome c oxidase cbb3-type subunit I/II
MPSYSHFATNVIDWSVIQKRVNVMAMLGVPYGNAVTQAEPMARAQATEIGNEIDKSGGPSGLQDKEIVAIVAYIQRLGRDIKGDTAKVVGAPVAAAPIVAARALRVTTGGQK